MLKLLFLPVTLVFRILSNPTLLKWIGLPVAAILLLAHFAPPHFWPLFKLYAAVEVALALTATAGK